MLDIPYLLSIHSVLNVPPQERIKWRDIWASRWPGYDRVIGPFFFSEKTVTGFVYLDLLEQYVFPQIETFEQETVSKVIFMKDGAPPHFSCFVTDV